MNACTIALCSSVIVSGKKQTRNNKRTTLIPFEFQTTSESTWLLKLRKGNLCCQLKMMCERTQQGCLSLNCSKRFESKTFRMQYKQTSTVWDSITEHQRASYFSLLRYRPLEHFHLNVCLLWLRQHSDGWIVCFVLFNCQTAQPRSLILYRSQTLSLRCTLKYFVNFCVMQCLKKCLLPSVMSSRFLMNIWHWHRSDRFQSPVMCSWTLNKIFYLFRMSKLFYAFECQVSLTSGFKQGT